MATVDDQATQVEERDRELCLRVRKPVGPPPCGVCYNCGEALPADHRFCDVDCRDDWEKRQ